jgi:polysaccharide biosynthesis protein PslH
LTRPLSILVLTRFRPDRLDGGAALRNHQNIRALAQLGTVDVVPITERPEPGPGVPAIRTWIPLSLKPKERRSSAWERWRLRYWWVRPRAHPAVDRYRQASISKALRAQLASVRYDLAVIEELKLAPYLPLLRRRVGRIVFDAHNVESKLRAELDRIRDNVTAFAALKHSHRAHRLFMIEREAVRQADLVWACSRADADWLEQLYQPRSPVTVVPNGVELNAYASSGAIPADADWTDHPVTLCFIAAYSYRPNGDAARELIETILPLVRQRAPSARLRLIGRDPTEFMSEAAAADRGITVTGAVDSVVPWLREPSIVVVPLTIGSGTRLKILEAFAAGRPVISSPKGAEGLGVNHNEHLLLRAEPEAIADSVVQLWRDSAKRAALCAHARRFLREHHSPEVIAQAVAQSVVGRCETPAAAKPTST